MAENTKSAPRSASVRSVPAVTRGGSVAPSASASSTRPTAVSRPGSVSCSTSSVDAAVGRGRPAAPGRRAAPGTHRRPRSPTAPGRLCHPSVTSAYRVQHQPRRFAPSRRKGADCPRDRWPLPPMESVTSHSTCSSPAPCSWTSCSPAWSGRRPPATRSGPRAWARAPAGWPTWRRRAAGSVCAPRWPPASAATSTATSAGPCWRTARGSTSRRPGGTRAGTRP